MLYVHTRPHLVTDSYFSNVIGFIKRWHGWTEKLDCSPFESVYERYIYIYILIQWDWNKKADMQQPIVQFLPWAYTCDVILSDFVPKEWNSIGQGNDLAHNRTQTVTWASDNPVHWAIHASLLMMMSCNQTDLCRYLVLGIHQSQVNSHQTRTVIRSLNVFFVIRPNKLLNKSWMASKMRRLNAYVTSS